MVPPPARSARQRKHDTLQRLADDVDAWIATADPATGTPYLIPLSYLWDGQTLLVATSANTVTSRNLLATGKLRVGIGPTRDVVLIEATAHAISPTDEVADAFATRAGFDPRTLSGYLYFQIEPVRLQAWRESNELPGRELLRHGQWVV
jgi:Pyridoxamine 5'-phosphate oxidase